MLAIAKGIPDTSTTHKQARTYVSSFATITQHRLGPISEPRCVKGIGLTCAYVCVAPVESDKGRLWEAQTEALDNGKAYLIDGPTRNTEHIAYTQTRLHAQPEPVYQAE